MDQIMFSDFMLVLDRKRNHYTKNDYFSRQITFTTIYLK
jgi:hypothetical protein